MKSLSFVGSITELKKYLHDQTGFEDTERTEKAVLCENCEGDHYKLNNSLTLECPECGYEKK